MSREPGSCPGLSRHYFPLFSLIVLTVPPTPPLVQRTSVGVAFLSDMGASAGELALGYRHFEVPPGQISPTIFPLLGLL